MPQDITLIKSNMAKMIDQGATDSDIQQYVNSEGVTADQLKTPIATPQGRGRVGLDQLNAFVDGVSDVASMGFDDEITAATGAAGGYLVDFIKGQNPNYSSLYNKQLEKARNRAAYDKQNNPGFRTAGQVGGALISPAAKTFKGGLTQAMVESGLYGAGSAEGNLSNRVQSGVVGAGVGLASGGLFRGLAEGGKGIGNYARKSDLINNAPSIDTLKNAASKLYSAAGDMGVKFDGFDSFVNKTTQEIKDAGSFKGGTDVTEGVLDSMRDMIGSNIDFVKLDQLRRRASTAANSMVSDDARLGRLLIEKIDNFVESSNVGTSQASKAARKLWQKNKKSEYIETALRNAEINPSGMKQGITVELRKLYRNPKIMRGWSNKEKKVLLDIIKGDASINTLNNLGKFSIGLGKNVPHVLSGGMGVGGAAAVGGALGGPVGAATGAAIMQGAGTVGREVSDALQQRNAQYLSSLIRSGMDQGQVKGVAKALEQIGNNNEAFQALSRMVSTQAIEKTSKLFGKGN